MWGSNQMMSMNKHFVLGALLVGWFSIAAQVGLGQTIPRLPELAAERWNFESPLWERGALLADFKVPSVDGKPATPAKQQTKVHLAHDGDHLFVRFTAFDTNMANVKAAALDEFADAFPQGDRGEIWITIHATAVFTFDPNGNKFDARAYDRTFFSGFQVKSRKLEDRWETIAVFPLSALLRNQPTKQLNMTFVRHVASGEGDPERSTASHGTELMRPSLTLE